MTEKALWKTINTVSLKLFKQVNDASTLVEVKGITWNFVGDTLYEV